MPNSRKVFANQRILLNYRGIIAMKHIFLTVLFVIQLSSCKSNDDGSIANDYTGFTTYTIDLKTAVDSVNILDYIDTSFCEAIVLESKDGFLIGEIQNIAYRGDTIIIVDSQTKSILFFDKNGKAISKICRIGRARGEYTNIYASYISDDKIYIYDSNQWRIVCYDFKGNLVSAFECPDVNSLAVYNDTVFVDKWWHGTKVQGNFVDLLAGDGSLIKNEIHKKTTDSEKPFIHYPQKFLISYPNNLSYWVDFDDMVFKYKNGAFEPYYKLEYADKIKVPRSAINKGPEYLYNSYAYGYVWYTNSILETTNHIFAFFEVRYKTQPSESYSFIVDKTTSETLLTKNLFDGDLFRFGGIQDRNFFFTFLRGVDMRFYRAECEKADANARFSNFTMKECLKMTEGISETDNGIIFIKKMK